MLYATVRQRKIHVKNPVTVIQNGVNVDQLVLDMDDEWREMTSIVCVFTNGDVAKEMLHTFGETVLVPWECLANTGRLSVSCTGYVGSEKVMTTMLPDSFWNVVQNGAITGDTPMEPTPTLYEQVLSAANAANSAATKATEVSDQLLEDKENGVFNGAPGAPGLTPYIGANNNWWIGTTDTGYKAKGEDGKDGVGILDVGRTEGTGAPGTIDIYTITFTNGEETTFSVYNGVDGKDGIAGKNGVDGVSPAISVSSITGGHRITITDATGSKSVDVLDGVDGKDGSDGQPGADGSDGKDGRGITKIERTGGSGAAGSADTYTITYSDNTTSRFTVYNGADGTSFVVKDRYETLNALQTAHPTGAAGDAYAVGAEDDNVIYIWGEDTGTWTPIGSLQGPQGVAGQDASPPEFQQANGYLQWRLVGETAWKNLVPLSQITGPAGSDGQTGAAGAAGADGKTPMIGSNGNWFIGEEDTGVLANASYGSTVRYDQAQELSDEQKAQARANIGAGTSNFSGNYNDLTNKPALFSGSYGDLTEKPLLVRPNLLDNWYFLNPVNQRGQTEYTGLAFSIDRWKKSSSTATLTLTAEGITIATASSAEWLVQNLDIDLAGKTVTLSALLSNGTMVTKTGVVSDTTGTRGPDIYVGWGNVYVSKESFGVSVAIRPNASQTRTFVAIKLELGEGQTLAHQDADGNWVLNEIPDYGEQLARCQRYQVSVVRDANYAIANGVSWGDSVNQAAIIIEIPVTMRAKPSLSSYTVYKCFVNGAEKTVTSLEPIDLAAAGVRVRVQSDTAFAKGDVILCMLQNVFLDANL